MSITVETSSRSVLIHADGIDRVWALSGGVTLRPDEVTSAFVASRRELLEELGWRMAGTYFPGLMALGHYAWRGRRGVRQLWFAYADDELLAIDTTRDKPARIVVQHPDRTRLAAEINSLR